MLSNCKRVLFVDDEPFYADPFIRVLNNHVDVYFFRDAASASLALEEIASDSFLVIDVMMPPPTLDVAFETEDGQVTGLWLLRKHKARLLAKNIPVLVLTNKDIDVVEYYINENGLLDLNIQLRSKFSVTPEVLVEQVKSRKK